ncbi:MAG: SWIM zinc finger family protein [Bacteroidota bacterium]
MIQQLLKHNDYLLQEARKIARHSSWETLERQDHVLHGQYRTKRTTYTTYIDLRHEKPAFRCTCKSRKTPCKHALALLVLLHERKAVFQEVQEFPEDLQVWLKRRDNRLNPKERTADQEAQLAQIRQNNWEKRLAQMSKGLHDLELWLEEVVRIGLANLYERDAAYWEAWSATLVDAKLGSLAKRVKAIPEFFLEEHWHEALLAELGDLYLLVKGFQNIEELPSDLQQELFNTLGVSVKKEQVLQTAPVQDLWCVLGKHEGTEEHLSFQRTWLWGKNTQRYALLLDYSWGGKGFAQDLPIGRVLQAEMCFYPASFPQRALLKTYQLTEQPFETRGYTDFLAFQKAYAKALAQHPWLGVFPVILEQVRPFFHQQQLYLSDANDLYLACDKDLDEQTAWQIIALSGGHPIQIFGEWKNQQFLPLGVVAENRFVDFSS